MDEEKLRKQLAKQIEQSRKAQEAEKQVRVLLLKILDSAAYERMMNVRISNPELYANTINALVYFYKQTKRKITDEELLALLSSQTARRETGIEVKRK